MNLKRFKEHPGAPQRARSIAVDWAQTIGEELGGTSDAAAAPRVRAKNETKAPGTGESLLTFLRSKLRQS